MTIHYFSSGKHFVEKKRNDNIREAKRLINITSKLNGLKMKTGNTEYSKTKKGLLYQFDDLNAYRVYFGQPQVTVSIDPITNSFSVENDYFKQRIKNGTVSILPEPKIEGKVEEYIWKESEKILYSYFPKTKYPNYKFKRRMIYGWTNEYNVPFWDVYYKGYRITPGGVGINYYYKRGFTEIRSSLCNASPLRINITKRKALEKAKNRASLYIALIPGLKLHVDSIELILISPRFLKGIKQPIYSDMVRNYSHRLMYKIDIQVLDDKYENIIKSKALLFDHIKGAFWLYVDAESGKLYMDYMNLYEHEFYHYDDGGYSDWFRDHYPDYFKFWAN